MSRIKCNYFKREKLSEALKQPFDIKVQLLQSYQELTSLLANDLLEELTLRYCGDAYSNYGKGQYQRYGSNPGSIRQGAEKFRVDVPRIKDKATDKVFNVPEYKDISCQQEPDDQLLQAMLKGISTRDYQSVLQTIEESFGLSSSSVSRQFQEKSQAKLEEFHNRCLEGYHFVALMLDGKYLADDQIVIALGITEDGQKIPLDFIQTTTENHKAIKGLLSNLIERGLAFEEGILVCLDGSKGMYKAVQETFGHKALIQRCQWHKRENVIAHLKEDNQQLFKGKMQRAYEEPEYEVAKEKLLAIEEELEAINKTAANSLKEGLEETLTLHRIEAPVELRTTFSTTNCIENLNSQLSKYIGRVKRWNHSDQKHRWIACGLLEVEGKMRRISYYKKIKNLEQLLKLKTENS